MVKIIMVMNMKIWNIVKNLMTFKPNFDREGFVLKETPEEKSEIHKEIKNRSKSEEKSKNSDRQREQNNKKEQKSELKKQPEKSFSNKSDESSTSDNEKEKGKERGKIRKPVRTSARGEKNNGNEDRKSEDKPRLKKPLKVSEFQEDPDKVSPYLEFNKKRVEEIYGMPENKDFVIREFVIAVSPPVRAFALFMEGLSDKTIINRDVLQPMMLLSNYHEIVNGYLIDHIKERVIASNQVTVHDIFEELVGGVNYGSTAVFIEGCSQSLLVETKGWNSRGVEKPQNEMLVRGPQESFNETIRTNTALIRRYIKSSKLTTEMLKVGKYTHTDVAIMYLRDVANKQLVEEVKRRINSLKTDGIVDSGILEQFIEDRPWSIAPQVMATERPDRVAYSILRGKVAIVVDGNPYILVVPTTMFDQLHSQEDFYLRPLYGTFLRLVRSFAFYVAFLTPGVYLSIILFHKEMIPTELLLAIMGARERVPFPSAVEVIIMEISFELIREAGLRVPGVMGSTIGIVGALILGQAAVQANIVSPIMVIVIAVTGLASFAIPSYSLQFSLRIMRFFYIGLGAMLGFIGIVLGLFIQMHLFASLKSFGVPYLSPMAPTTGTTGDVVLRMPVFSWENREDFINAKRKRFQPKIARGWVKESSKREK